MTTRKILLLSLVWIFGAGAVFAAATPAAPSVTVASSTAAQPDNTALPKSETDALTELHPSVKYNPWLFGGMVAVIFGVLGYNEWSQRRRSPKPDAPGENDPEQR